MLSIFVDSAVYIALTVDYAQTWFHLTGLERWGLAVVLIAIFAYVNIGGQTLRHLFFAAMLAGNLALFIAFLAAGARPSYVLSKDKLMPKFLGKESKYGTPYLAILLMAGVDAILVRWGFKTLIVIDVFLLMLAHITTYISAVRLRVKQPDLPRPFKVKLGTKAFAAMCVVPVAVAVLAKSPFGNGWNYFVWGSVAALSGPPAYLIFKKIYGGRELPEVGFEYADDDGSEAAAPSRRRPARRIRVWPRPRPRAWTQVHFSTPDALRLQRDPGGTLADLLAATTEVLPPTIQPHDPTMNGNEEGEPDSIDWPRFARARHGAPTVRGKDCVEVEY